MAIEIRKMHTSDLEQVMNLLARWNIAPIAPSREVPLPERTEVIVDNTFVALDDDRIIGVCSFIQQSPLIGEGASTAVDPAYHRRGVGDQLALAVRREMYARGVRIVRSETDRPETVRWLIGRGHRVIGTVPKRHAFGSPEITEWTVLEFDLSSLPGLRDTSSE